MTPRTFIDRMAMSDGKRGSDGHHPGGADVSDRIRTVSREEWERIKKNQPKGAFTGSPKEKR